MISLRSRIMISAARLMWVVLAIAAPLAANAQAAARLPERLTDAAFWKLMSDISEPGGYFQIEDNFTSNEPEVARVYTMLRDAGISGGVYMGVGPEQNFTYIASIRPAMAFIVDIRRQAVMQHLMFKAIYEMSPTRADFIAMLFSKPRPAGLDTASTIQQLWDAFWYVPSDSSMWRANYAKISDLLIKTHGFELTADEVAQLKWVFDSFFVHGPTISTRGAPGGRGGGNGTTFADLTGYQPDNNGRVQSFLSTEDNYRYIKSLHEKNLIVAVSGDFGGPKAIRAIGSYIKENGGTVSAFYVSNVEQYLFNDGKQSAFYASVGTLPLTAKAVFIRPYSVRRAGIPLCPVSPFLSAVSAGRVSTWNSAQDCVR